MTGRPTPPEGRAPKRTPKRTVTRIIAVGDLYPPELGTAGAEASDIVYLTFDEVSAEMLQRLKPDVILSPPETADDTRVSEVVMSLLAE